MANPKELNPIIEQLSRIDKMAAEETARAAEKKEAILDEYEACRAEYEASLKAEAEKSLMALKAEVSEETDKKIALVRAEYEARSAKLDEEYARNGQQWAENIFNAVTGGRI